MLLIFKYEKYFKIKIKKCLLKKQTIFNPIKRLFGVNSKLIAIGKMLE